MTIQPTPPGGNRLGTTTRYGYNGQAINSGNVMERHGKESGLGQWQGSADGMRGANDYQAGEQAASAANIQRGVDTQNAQQHMKEQGVKADLTQTAMANQARIYGDMAQRETSQVRLAQGLQEAIMRHRNALLQTLTQS